MNAAINHKPRFCDEAKFQYMLIRRMIDDLGVEDFPEDLIEEYAPQLANIRIMDAKASRNAVRQ